MTTCVFVKNFFKMFISSMNLELNFIYSTKIDFFPKRIISCSNTLYRAIHVGSIYAHLKGRR